jgi:hypothetical protein
VNAAKPDFLGFNSIENGKANLPDKPVPLGSCVPKPYAVAQNWGGQNQEIFIDNIVSTPHQGQGFYGSKKVQSRPGRSAKRKAPVFAGFPDNVRRRLFQVLMAVHVCGG